MQHSADDGHSRIGVGIGGDADRVQRPLLVQERSAPNDGIPQRECRQRSASLGNRRAQQSARSQTDEGDLRQHVLLRLQALAREADRGLDTALPARDDTRIVLHAV